MLSMVLKPICSCCLGHSHLMTVFTMVSDAFQVILAVLKPIQHLGITNIRCSQCICSPNICLFNQPTPLMSQISAQGLIAFTTDFKSLHSSTTAFQTLGEEITLKLLSLSLSSVVKMVSNFPIVSIGLNNQTVGQT